MRIHELFMEFLSEAFSFDWKLALVDLLRIALAFLIAMPLAWERYQSKRNLGLRTFPIVAMASCGFVLISRPLTEGNPETMARILQGLMSGIGFVGGGAILKKGSNVEGLATAASIWSTGAIGAAIGFGREEIALILSLITFLTLRLLTPIVEKDDYDRGLIDRPD